MDFKGSLVLNLLNCTSRTNTTKYFFNKDYTETLIIRKIIKKLTNKLTQKIKTASKFKSNCHENQLGLCHFLFLFLNYITQV